MRGGGELPRGGEGYRASKLGLGHERTPPPPYAHVYKVAGCAQTPPGARVCVHLC
jgi:hypothetical protein